MTFFSLEFLAIFVVFILLFNSVGKAFKLPLLALFNAFLIYLFGEYFLKVVFVFSLAIYLFAYILSLAKRFANLLFGFFVLCIVLNLALFKYYADFKDFLDIFLPINDLIFALGLSFYSFNAITLLAYIRKNPTQMPSFLQVFAYLSFFATFIAGPIFRYEQFALQMQRNPRFKFGNLSLILILFALFKIFTLKPLCSDFMVENPQDFLSAMNNNFLYSFNLYLDFSGYVDFVSVLAFCIGFKLPRNFAAPLKATNIIDFWRRWHISLSLFIRDFIYIPLGGSRRGKWRKNLNIIIAFSLSGIWHGSGINFLFWGLAHALGNCFNHAFRFKIPALLAAFFTFFYVSFAWSFFYIETFSEWQEHFAALCNFSLEWSECVKTAVIFALFAAYFYCKNPFIMCVKFYQNLGLLCQMIVLFVALFLCFCLMPNGIANFIYASF